MLVGLRSIDEYMHFLDGKGRSLLGDVATAAGEALAYDALVDGELALEIVRRVAPDFPANAVRPLPVDQTNTSIVVDDSAILKVFRRIRSGANPDAELPRRLWEVGFQQTPEPIAEWRRGDDDLAVLRRFLPSGTDGFVLALTSLRDLYSSRLPPEQCGGDFAPEARRLGEVTASLHTSLAQAFGSAPGDAAGWTEGLADEVTRVEVPGVSPDELVVRVRAAGRPRRCRRGRGRAHPRRLPPRPDACAPTRAGSCSTSRASPHARSTSGCCRPRPCATWRA